MKKLLLLVCFSVLAWGQKIDLGTQVKGTLSCNNLPAGGCAGLPAGVAAGSQAVSNGVGQPPIYQAKPYVDLRDYSPATITLATPASAPTLTLAGPIFGRNTFTNGHTICAEQTYAGVDNGETTASGTNCVVISANHPAVAIFPSAPLGARGSVGANIYVNDNGGTFAHAKIGPDGIQKQVGFGDFTSWGGAIVNGTIAGTPPGSNTAHDGDGTLIAIPTTAPTIFLLGNLPLNTTFYAAFSYVAGDGTETGLSPASASQTTPAAESSYAEITLPREPPSGAMCVNEYLSTDGSTWHKQASCIPLAYVTYDIHTYDASGATPSAGTAQSTLCEFQQAYDAMLNAGGGTVIVPVKSGDWACTTPVIFHLRNNSSTVIAGMKIMGLAGHDPNGTSARSSINYSGTQSGVDCVVNVASGLVLSGVDFKDTTKRCSAGIEYADWNSGSFQNHYSDCSFSGLAVNGFGLSVPRWGELYPAGTNHVASEQNFDECSFQGGGWNIDIHSPQSVDFRFKDVTMGSALNTATANSGDVRIEAGNVQFNGFNSNCSGEYMTYQTDDENNGGGGGGGANLTMERAFANALTCPYLFYISNLNTNGPSLAVSHSTVTNTTTHQQTAFYVGSSSTIELHDNTTIAGGSTSNVVFNPTVSGHKARLMNADPTGNGFTGSYLSAFGFGGGFTASPQEHFYGSAGIDFWQKSGNSIVQGATMTPYSVQTGNSANQDNGGRITLSGGSGSYNFQGTYSSAPVCTARDATTPANCANSSCISGLTSGTLTITGTGSDIIEYLCFPRN